eukprot:TRINITY_DN17745_c0_g1_i1.p1 TRINITY_DN17745_c0_g1~~TRINITY_DN17745_c0_g1_i1.p1  ORF type:complete len:164 (-),score=24.12 TRINITY_DN17745_c0_g1_i1:459-950(-)
MSATPNVRDWTAENVYEWTSCIVGSKFAQILKDQEIDGSSLSELTRVDLERLDVPTGVAVRLERAIKSLNVKQNFRAGTIPSKVGDVDPKSPVVVGKAGTRSDLFHLFDNANETRTEESEPRVDLPSLNESNVNQVQNFQLILFHRSTSQNALIHLLPQNFPL